MDVQLQELIDKIKKEGLDTADRQAQNLTREAEDKAKAIIAKAHADAEEIRNKAKQDAARFEESSKAAVKQAARDVTLTVKKSLEDLFGKLALDAVKQSYNASVVEEMLVALAKNWAQFPSGATVQVTAADQKKLADALKAKLKDLAAKGVTLQLSTGTQLGFKIQDGGAYYDFTEQTVAKALASYVGPAIAELVKQQE